ncbi:MAG: peptide-methionine (S)-S-oxide reductase MsrA [Bacteroidales bacterium]|nr:peptide-methionine (S)-S-oxide reductase MsrA [Bacteroidales bacterium]
MKRKAYFAGGCFWGVEHLMQQQKGVISVVSGYMGGNMENPTYEQVKSHITGHAETVEVLYDPLQVSYLTLLKLFMEIHDPTQLNRQGVDVGPQYRSEIFYQTEQERSEALDVIQILKEKGYNVATRVTPASKFWVAEEYHQDYCKVHNIEPECHVRVRRF